MADEPIINSYRDLRVWQDAMTLAELCYRLTRDFPKAETLGFSSQVRRAAASIPANIAEGHRRENTKVFIQYLRIAQGSLKELETHLLLAGRIGMSAETKLEPLIAHCESLGKMLRSLIRALQKRTAEQ